MRTEVCITCCTSLSAYTLPSSYIALPLCSTNSLVCLVTLPCHCTAIDPSKVGSLRAIERVETLSQAYKQTYRIRLFSHFRQRQDGAFSCSLYP